MKVGRPTNYKSEYCELGMKLFKQGKSISQLAVEIGVHRGRLYEWAEQHPEFKDTLRLGMDLAQSYWENLHHGKSVAAKGTKNFSERAIEFNLKTRFRRDYSEKIEQEISGAKVQINIDQADDKL